ncbi:MAG: class I SAM-dependent methyltransferase, partial [Alphaproteobacteria bacterium]|nr:class I SAM-dependent methyltransferase [Alphaproteobacteria bacterium]
VLYRVLQAALRGSTARRHILDHLLGIRPGHRVLDIGCGPASILSLMPAGIDYVGFDTDSRYIAAARNRHGMRGQFAVRAVTPEAVNDLGYFDRVIAIGVLHHLTDADADILFASAARVLKPDGRIVTIDGAFVPGQSPLAWLLLKLDRGRHVRTPQAYLEIARRHFPRACADVVHDLLVVPYTHCIIKTEQSP